MSTLPLITTILFTTAVIGLWMATPQLALALIFVEITWVATTALLSVLAVQLNSLPFIIWIFLILCIATYESAIGLAILLISKNQL